MSADGKDVAILASTAASAAQVRYISAQLNIKPEALWCLYGLPKGDGIAFIHSESPIPGAGNAFLEALSYALEVAEEPLTTTVLADIHRRLYQHDSKMAPGVFRTEPVDVKPGTALEKYLSENIFDRYINVLVSVNHGYYGSKYSVLPIDSALQSHLAELIGVFETRIQKVEAPSRKLELILDFYFKVKAHHLFNGRTLDPCTILLIRLLCKHKIHIGHFMAATDAARDESVAGIVEQFKKTALKCQDDTVEKSPDSWIKDYGLKDFMAAMLNWSVTSDNPFHRHIFEAILQAYPALVNVCDAHGNPPLINATCCHHVYAVERLLATPGIHQYPYGKDGMTASAWANQLGYSDILSKLPSNSALSWLYYGRPSGEHAQKPVVFAREYLSDEMKFCLSALQKFSDSHRRDPMLLVQTWISLRVLGKKLARHEGLYEACLRDLGGITNPFDIFDLRYQPAKQGGHLKAEVVETFRTIASRLSDRPPLIDQVLDFYRYINSQNSSDIQLDMTHYEPILEPEYRKLFYWRILNKKQYTPNAEIRIPELLDLYYSTLLSCTSFLSRASVFFKDLSGVKESLEFFLGFIARNPEVFGPVFIQMILREIQDSSWWLNPRKHYHDAIARVYEFAFENNTICNTLFHYILHKEFDLDTWLDKLPDDSFLQLITTATFMQDEGMDVDRLVASCLRRRGEHSPFHYHLNAIWDKPPIKALFLSVLRRHPQLLACVPCQQARLEIMTDIFQELLGSANVLNEQSELHMPVQMFLQGIIRHWVSPHYRLFSVLFGRFMDSAEKQRATLLFCLREPVLEAIEKNDGMLVYLRTIFRSFECLEKDVLQANRAGLLKLFLALASRDQQSCGSLLNMYYRIGDAAGLTEEAVRGGIFESLLRIHLVKQPFPNFYRFFSQETCWTEIIKPLIIEQESGVQSERLRALLLRMRSLEAADAVEFYAKMLDYDAIRVLLTDNFIHDPFCFSGFRERIGKQRCIAYCQYVILSLPEVASEKKMKLWMLLPTDEITPYFTYFQSLMAVETHLKDRFFEGLFENLHVALTLFAHFPKDRTTLFLDFLKWIKVNHPAWFRSNDLCNFQKSLPEYCTPTEKMERLTEMFLPEDAAMTRSRMSELMSDDDAWRYWIQDSDALQDFFEVCDAGCSNSPVS